LFSFSPFTCFSALDPPSRLSRGPFSCRTGTAVKVDLLLPVLILFLPVLSSRSLRHSPDTPPLPMDANLWTGLEDFFDWAQPSCDVPPSPPPGGPQPRPPPPLPARQEVPHNVKFLRGVHFHLFSPFRFSPQLATSPYVFFHGIVLVVAGHF